MQFKQYKSDELEPAILSYWQNNNTIEELRKRNKQGKKFYFLDGPPYTSGKFHLAHAWNYALKDMIIRYKRMHGFNVWDRNGFDVHGLPTEHKVMSKYGLKTKEDITTFGIGKFVKECQKFCLEMADVMTKDLIRMGVTVDVSNPYMALKTEFMEGEWALIKKAHQKKLLYYGEKVLTWCQHCETAVAKHECEYENVSDKSIFVKFQVKDQEDTYLIIWTTTPWTIPFNLGVMAGPKIDYVELKVGKEKWIVAKDLAKSVADAAGEEDTEGEDVTILKEYKGKKLEGLEYIHPFAKEIPKYSELKKKHKNVHTVIMSEEYVDTSAGSGLVHSAPGCGPEDQEACKPYDIPPFNTLSEDGFFSEEMGSFAGLRAKVDDPKFIKALEDSGALITTKSYHHEYPHCWRCKNPIVFRITFQWFFNTSAIKKQILKDNKKVNWVPDTALNSYESWIDNLKDNSITRQRYWGTPIPIWKCVECKNIKIVGSKKEIEENGGKAPENIHIPWIDKVTLDCKCGKKMKRTPDVIDVWVDAGTVSWNCLDNDPKKLKEWYPADYIMEAKEQTRLWFSMLNICSYLYLGEKSFKNVYVHGMLNDIEGKKMSKSIGNIISPYELIDKHGVDVLRYYMCQNNAGEDINFSWDECIVKQRNLMILWNLHKLVINLAKENNLNPAKLSEDKALEKNKSVEEKFIISKLNTTIKKVTELLDNYQLDQSIAPLEELFLELSRTYIQMVRDKSSVGTVEEKKLVLQTTYKILMDCLAMFSVISPFITEAIYLNLQNEFKLKEKSVSHLTWPKYEAKEINLKLEEQVDIVKGVIQSCLHAREKSKLGLRWPVAEMVIVTENKESIQAVEKLQETTKKQTNCKSIKIKKTLPGLKTNFKPNFSRIGQEFGDKTPVVVKAIQKIKSFAELEKLKVGKQQVTKDMVEIMNEVPQPYFEAIFKHGFVYCNSKLTKELEAEGFAREFTRYVQNLRKKSGLEKQDKIKLTAEMEVDLAKHLTDITVKVGAKSIKVEKIKGKFDEFKIKSKTFKVKLEKV